MRAAAPVVGILDWSPTIDEYLDSVGLDLDRYLAELSGGWLFGYVAALQRAGCHVVLYAVSREAHGVRRATHAPTGCTVCLLPAGAAHRATVGWLPSVFTTPYWSGPDRGLLARLRWRLLRAALPYLRTPTPALVQALRDDGCTALLCQEYESARFDVAVRAVRRTGVPVSATFQGGTGDDRGGPLEWLLRRGSIRRAHRLVVAPDAEAQRVAARYGVAHERLARIFNPLDLADWPPIAPAERAAARIALGVAPHAVTVVWHGRVKTWDKGLDVLLAAWPLVRAAHPGADPRLLLLGTGPDAASFAGALRRAGDPSIVHLDRFTSERAEVRRFLAAGDAYVFPSRREGMPVAPVEAMACALPVVAAAASGTADLFPAGERSGGIVVPTADADALASALSSLVVDPAHRAALGAAARARVESAFSLDVVGRQLRQALLPEAFGSA